MRMRVTILLKETYSDCACCVVCGSFPRCGGSGLLVKVGLNTALLSLALIVLGLVLGLVGSVACDAGNSATDGARNTVGDTRAQVVELALGLLLLALLVLLSTLLLQGLVANEVAKGLLPGAQGLPPMLAPACEASFLRSASAFLFSPAVCPCVSVLLTDHRRDKAYLVGVAADDGWDHMTSPTPLTCMIWTLLEPIVVDDALEYDWKSRFVRVLNMPARAALLRSEFFPIVIYSENHQSDVHFKDHSSKVASTFHCVPVSSPISFHICFHDSTLCKNMLPLPLADDSSSSLPIKASSGTPSATNLRISCPKQQPRSRYLSLPDLSLLTISGRRCTDMERLPMLSRACRSLANRIGKEYLRFSRHAARPRPKVSCSTFRGPSGPEGSHPLARLGVQRSREMAVTFGVEDDECDVKKDNRQISDDYRHDAANSHKSLNSGSGRQVATNVQPWDATIVPAITGH
ncbi:hypothetical protein KCU93_g244, partial [Aureobasidium melanogenum]